MPLRSIYRPFNDTRLRGGRFNDHGPLEARSVAGRDVARDGEVPGPRPRLAHELLQPVQRAADDVPDALDHDRDAVVDDVEVADLPGHAAFGDVLRLVEVLLVD